MNDPRQILADSIIASKTPEELYNYISKEIVDEDGVISFYFFDVAMVLLNVFYEKSKFSIFTKNLNFQKEH